MEATPPPGCTRPARSPYKGRVALALGFLLLSTLAALAPPYLAKLAIDDGIAKGDLTVLGWIVGAFVAAGLVYLGANAAQTYFTGWTGERVLADLRNGLFRISSASRSATTSAIAPASSLAG